MHFMSDRTLMPFETEFMLELETDGTLKLNADTTEQHTQ